jgi:hypothetical protein
MKRIDYFKYAMRNKLLDKLNWYYSVLSLQSSDYVENEYIKYQNKKYYAMVDNNYVEIEDASGTIFDIKDVVKLSNSDLINIDKDVETTIGLAIVNYILLVNNFGKKIAYINDSMSVGSIEKIIVKMLNNDTITISEYTKFVDSCSFLTNFSRLVSVSATKKNILPPPGIKAHKKKSIDEMVKEYGPDWDKDFTLVKKFEDKLTSFDNEWMKDDPSNNMLVSGKVKGAGRTKTFLMFGAEAGFDRSGKATTITESLDEGWPQDSDKLATMFNASRSGSFDRGSETQKGGVTAKVVLRATNSVKINPGIDCGSKIGKSILINEINKQYIIDRYILVNGKSILLDEDNIKQYIGKYIDIRSPQYCKLDKNNLCGVCVGKKLEQHKDGISLLMTDISATILAISLSAMHFKELSTVELNMNETLT